jgi:tetratricopeptide (TPR) repeat protein
MQSRSRNDDLVMTLVEEALSRPEDDREAYLQRVCGSDAELFAKAWDYVQWEKRMQGFLLDPLQPPVDGRPPFEPGQVLINRFRLVREVAQGGMGVVWEALDEKLDRRVALKCAKAGFGKQLPPEVRNAREISHPNVCKIFEIHTASTVHGEIDFISMEFLEGETLADRIRRAPLGEREARTIAEQLCSGLAEAHHNHLIHGDLKPNNVILTKDAEGSVRAVITDFGLARRADASTAVLGGTPAYMAPELWKGEKPSVASDLYALGVMLWELRTGRSPSDLGIASTTLPLGERVHWKPPTGRGRWDRIIARCIDPDPTRRFKSATEVAAAFGLSRLQKQILTMAAALVLVTVTVVIANLIPPAPAETVQLALVPFASAPDNVSVAGTLLRNTAKELTDLKGTPHTRFRFISLDNAIRHRVNTPEEARVLLGASHALRATVKRQGENIVVHAYLTDLHSGVDARDWTAEYKPGEVRYAPTHLAALVTGTLHLPPPLTGSTVNAAARPSYLAGLEAVRRDGTVNEALNEFGRAVKADPGSALTFAGLAEAQWFKFAADTTDKFWLNRMSESVRQAQLRNPDLPQVHLIAGLLKFRENHYEQAIAEYLRAVELDPNNDDAYRRLGRAYEDNNQLDEAKAAFHKAVEKGPQQYRNSRAMGDFYYLRARYEEAAHYLQKTVELAPNEWHTWYGLGLAHLKSGQFASAKDELRSSISLKETSTALNALGLALMYEGEDRQAITHILRALKIAPKKYLCWMNLGTAYHRVHLLSDSQRAYRRALDLAEEDIDGNPRSEPLRTDLALLYARLGDRRRAESELVQALQQAPNNAWVLWTAVLTYEALGRRDDTLSVLAASPVGIVADVGRWPDVEDLHKDSRFRELLTSRTGEGR